MMKSVKVLLRICAKRKILALVAGLVVAVSVIAYFNRSGLIPPNTYVADKGGEIMIVDNDSVRIVRGKSTLYFLPNRTNRKVYDKDDLAKSRPQRLRRVNTDMVEWIREPAGPTPEYKVIFKSSGEN